MIAAPFHAALAAPCASVDLRKYVAARDAAAALGVHGNHLTRLCRDTLARDGMAVLLKAGAGKPSWFIRRSFDRRLEGSMQRHQRDPDLDRVYTGKQRRLALTRAACVDRFREWKLSKPGRVADWMLALIAALRTDFPEIRLTDKTLYRWASVYDGPADLEKLIDDRGGNTRKLGDAAAWKFFEAIFLDRRRPKLSACYRQTEAESKRQGWQWCSNASCRRQLDDRIPEATRMAHRDPASYRIKYAPFNGKDFCAVTWSGQTKTQRRRQVIDSPDPSGVGIYKLLGIQPHYSIEYCPNGKARQERWYGTLHDQFDRTFSTYCGAKPDERPEGLTERLAAKRDVPTFSHVAARLSDFIRGFNERAAHAMGDLADETGKLSPNDAMRRWCVTRRTFQEGVLELALQHWAKPMHVGRNGVTVTIAGARLSYGNFDTALIPFKNKKRVVMVSYDPGAMQKVKVYDDRFRLICEPTANGLWGLPLGVDIGRDALRAQMRLKAEYDRAVRLVQANPELECLSTIERALEAAVKAEPVNPAPTPADAMKLVTTPLDAEVRQQMRKAAGAELADLDGRGLPSPASFNNLSNLPVATDGDDDDFDRTSWAAFTGVQQ